MAKTTCQQALFMWFEEEENED
jgi:hypothetical protein